MLRAFVDQIRLTWALLRDPRVPLWAKAIPAIGILYVLSPLDFIPDWVPVVGMLDDVAVLGFAAKAARSDLAAFRQWEGRKGAT